tara:strand:+ start:2008 stop:2442 length:435 start_codon:yes stop_codon:yes gene_type:complete
MSITKKKTVNNEVNVPKILKKDGVENVITKYENKKIVNYKKIQNIFKDKKNWAYRIVNTKSNSATLISQRPGKGNRRHFHANWDEWWFILKGKGIFEFENKKQFVKRGDFVLIKRNNIHMITATGNTDFVRLAVSRADVIHSYV